MTVQTDGRRQDPGQPAGPGHGRAAPYLELRSAAGMLIVPG
jgi:hypothetical protein